MIQKLGLTSSERKMMNCENSHLQNLSKSHREIFILAPELFMKAVGFLGIPRTCGPPIIAAKTRTWVLGNVFLEAFYSVFDFEKGQVCLAHSN